jgi:sugar phosphate permease
MGSMPYSGTFVGMVIAMSTCGVLAQVYGWESVFYVYGIIGCVWYIFWVALVRGSPENDKFISEEEKRYIMASLRQSENSPKVTNIPYMAIFTSIPVWAICAS